MLRQDFMTVSLNRSVAYYMTHGFITDPGEYACRLVGCRRDAATLACAILRHRGVPARVRVGFASYLAPNLCVDHIDLDRVLNILHGGTVYELGMKRSVRSMAVGRASVAEPGFPKRALRGNLHDEGALQLHSITCRP